MKANNGVTIIIPVHNMAGLTERCIRSLVEHTGDVTIDIIVVDNHSSDGTEALLGALTRELPNLRTLRSPRNTGFGLGCNTGAQASQGEFLVFLNNDTEVLPGWLPPLVEPLAQNPGIGIVGPKLLYKNGTLQSGGLVFNHLSKMPYPIYEFFPGSHSAVNKPRCFQAVTGACLAIRANDFYRLQGFDPIYTNGMEDIDLCFRMRTRLEKEIRYNPASQIHHLKGQTPGRGRFVTQNRKVFVTKWGSVITADDTAYYREDGFIVEEYINREPDRTEGPAMCTPRLGKAL